MKLSQRALLLFGIAVIIFGLLGCQAVFSSAQYLVKRVSDGDTLTVTDTRGDNDIHVRFACVDAPEKNQVLGLESKKNLERLVAEAGNRVLLDIVEKDKYGRVVALVRTKQRSRTRLLQLEQIKAGLAWPYEQYASDCLVWNDVKDAAETAKLQHIGIWSKRNPIPPWKFRKQQRQKRVSRL